MQVGSFLLSYFLVYQSKHLFVTTKLLRQMTNEQARIVQKLPDGVLVIKQVDETEQTNTKADSSPSTSQPINQISQDMQEPAPNKPLKVKFYNETFKALFQLDHDFDEAIRSNKQGQLIVGQEQESTLDRNG